MVYAKRLIICIILGFITGLICYFGGKAFSDYEFTVGIAWATILNRTLIGFVIGVSAWRMNFLLHGVLMGAIVTVPMAVAAADGFWVLLIFGVIWGFLIELFATKVFKAPVKMMEK